MNVRQLLATNVIPPEVIMASKQGKKSSRPGKKQEHAQELSEKELEQATGGVIAIIRDTGGSDAFGVNPGPIQANPGPQQSNPGAATVNGGQWVFKP